MASTGPSISVGANPGATFPNSHLAGPAMQAGAKGGGGGVWSQVQPMKVAASPRQQLMDAVAAQDWKKAFEESKTTIQADANWSATAERCAILQCLCHGQKAEHILEIGSFCGVSALAMAEALPKDGYLVSLELEKYFVEFGAEFRMKSQAGSRMETKVGPAVESLKDLVAEVTDGDRKPFDFVVIDGDKSSMAEYLKYVRSPYFLSEKAVICMDVTPFKGQAPTRYKKFDAEEAWKTVSGDEEIAALRKAVDALPDHVSHEFGGLLVIQPKSSTHAQLDVSDTRSVSGSDDDDEPRP